MYLFEVKDNLKRDMENLKKSNKTLYEQLEKKMYRILENPQLSKPLKNIMSGTRRVHVGHFVLIFEIIEAEKKIIFLKFAHHDDAYM